jgi:uncharacterized membrane protein
MKLLIIHAIIISLGLFGFILASYIHRKKTAKKKLVCPMRSNCETVIHSDYSKLLGIPVEVLGMCYYAFIALSYGIYHVVYIPQFVLIILSGISLSAVLFSTYLISLQAFVIRQWCTWCLCSAITSAIIFGLSSLAVSCL